jgi:hypothetical protein
MVFAIDFHHLSFSASTGTRAPYRPMRRSVGRELLSRRLWLSLDQRRAIASVAVQQDRPADISPRIDLCWSMSFPTA